MTSTRFLLAAMLMAQSSSPPIAELRTRAEISNYEETSTHADVERFIAGLGASPLVHVESFGKTEEGRNLPLVVITDPKVTSPEAARRAGRPLVFIQANIHGGEVEGKEASLALARRLVDGDLRPLTRQLVVLMAPIYNADGNDRISLQNRTAQNGPIGGVGTRENAKGLDLNRDYMKLESAEARALVGLMNRWDPHIVVDLHTTNGSYHGYHLTYSPMLNPNADARLVRFERETLLPAVQKTMREKHGFRTYYYGNFAPETPGGRGGSRVDPANPGDVTWRTFDHRPRYGNNYVGLRNRLTVLSEAYSYLDFKGRIEVTAALVEEILRASIVHSNAIRALTSGADRDLRAATPAGRPKELGVQFAFAASPTPVDILVGDVTRVANPRSGREMSQMTGMAVPVRMKEYGHFVPTRSAAWPDGWLISRDDVNSGRLAPVIDRLHWHGVEVQRVTAATKAKDDPFVIQPGSLFISSRQRLARLAFYLLEADSDDGFVAFGRMSDRATAGAGLSVRRVLDASLLRAEPLPR